MTLTVKPSPNLDKWFVQAAWWMADHWEVPFGFVVGYILMLVFLPKVMEKRKAFDLKTPLAAWNFLLAIFSIVGTYYVLPPAIRTLSEGGLQGHLCLEFEERENPWVFLFCISKIPELIDTLFLILRKKPVIFLHWFHHIATLLYCWWGWSSQSPTGGTFAVMNLFVHSIMYTYYGIMAAGVRVPVFFAKPITVLQISQMVLGLFACSYGALHCENDNNEQRAFNITGSAMYIVYALLFLQMYVSKYIIKSKKSAADKKAAGDAAHVNGKATKAE